MAQKINGVTVNNWVDDIAESKSTLASIISTYVTTDSLTETLANYATTDSLTTVMTYKGSVDTEDDLPTSGNSTGDFYNVTDTGKNYAWNGSEWDEVSGVMDASSIVGTSATMYLTANSDYDSDGEGWSSPVWYSAGVTGRYADGSVGARAARSDQFGTVKLSIDTPSVLDAGGAVGINTDGQLLTQPAAEDTYGAVKPIVTTSDCGTSNFGAVTIGNTSYVGTSSAYVGLLSSSNPSLVVGKATNSSYGVVKLFSSASAGTTHAGLLLNSSGQGYIEAASTSYYGSVMLSSGIADGDTGVPTGGDVYTYVTDALSSCVTTDSLTEAVSDSLTEAVSEAMGNYLTTSDAESTYLTKGTATGSGSVAAPSTASASSYTSSTVYGDGAVAAGPYVTVFGASAYATSASSTAETYPPISIGYRAGRYTVTTTDDDGNETSTNYYNRGICIGTGTIAGTYNNIAIGTNAYAGTATNSSGRLAVGGFAYAGVVGTALGSSSTASGNYSVAVGRASTASGSNSVAAGNSSTASGTSSVAAGYSSTASGNYSVAAGSSAKSTSARGTALGSMARNTCAWGTALGARTANFESVPCVKIGAPSADTTSSSSAVCGVRYKDSTAYFFVGKQVRSQSTVNETTTETETDEDAGTTTTTTTTETGTEYAYTETGAEIPLDAFITLITANGGAEYSNTDTFRDTTTTTESTTESTGSTESTDEDSTTE